MHHQTATWPLLAGLFDGSNPTLTLVVVFLVVLAGLAAWRQHESHVPEKLPEELPDDEFDLDSGSSQRLYRENLAEADRLRSLHGQLSRETAELAGTLPRYPGARAAGRRTELDRIEARLRALGLELTAAAGDNHMDVGRFPDAHRRLAGVARGLATLREDLRAFERSGWQAGQEPVSRPSNTANSDPP